MRAARFGEAPTRAERTGDAAASAASAATVGSDVTTSCRGGRNLGFFGSAAGDLPNLPRNVDDFLLWTTVPFITPFPSWMYHEQLGDLVR